jgi:hypothetical protein
MTSARRYVLTVLALLAGAFAAAIAFNVRIDPYALDGAQADGTPAAERRRGAFFRKVEHARQAKARSVILGTSRAASGIPVEHPAYTARRQPVINLALGGASIDEMRLLLIHAHASAPLREAIVGLDLEAFMDQGRTDFDPGLLAGNPASRPAPLSWLRMQVSRDTLYASVRRQWGLGDDAEPERIDAPTGPDAEDDSQRIAVWTTEFRNFHGRLPALFPRPGPRSDWSGDAKRQAAMTTFGQLLRYARRENIQLHLFISPVHARYLDWYRRVGWWPLYEGWKRGLAAEIDREAAESPGRQPFVLWDMSGFRGPAAEAVPRLDDATSRMQWYLETSHYNDKLGSRIVAIVLGATAPGDDWPVARIDARTVNAHLLRLYADADAWRETNRGETANVAAMVAYLRRYARR